MKLNLSKTKLLLFNPCISKDFMPEMKVDDTRIDLVEQVKLLGVIISSDLTWTANTQYIVDRCNSKTWILRRLKKLGASHEDLLNVYCKQIRSIAEFAPSSQEKTLLNLKYFRRLDCTSYWETILICFKSHKTI